MKNVLTYILALVLLSNETFSQKISDMPIYLGRGDSSLIPTLINGANRKMYAIDLSRGKVDSVTISNDSVYYWKNNGTRSFAGIGGSSGDVAITKSFTNLAALKASDFHESTGSLIAITQFYGTRAEAGGSTYFWDAVSTETTDDLYVINPTGHSGAGRWKKQFKGVVNAKEAGIVADGATDQTTRLNTIFNNASVNTVLFNDGDVEIDGTVELSGKILKIENGARLTGSGEITGGTIENPNRTQVFDLSEGLEVSDLNNSEIIAEWFGVRADALMDGTTVSPTDNAPLLQAAINAGVNRFTGSAYVFRTKVTVGAAPAGYCFYLGSTVLWNSSMEFAGAGQNSTIFVSPNGVGFRYTYPVDDENPGAEYFTAHDFSVFGAYFFYCQGYFDEDYNGIEIDNVNGYFYNIRVYAFRGNGWTFHGSGGGISVADNNTLISCSAYQCGGDGVELSGGDANNNTFILFNAYGNARLGIDDNSFLGNTYTGFHTSGNGFENSFNRSSVSYGGNWYASKVDNNINHLPTDANYWELLEAGGVSIFYPAWDNTTEYFVGGDIYLRDANQKGCLTGCYSEGGQYRPPNAGKNIIMGGFAAGVRSGTLINEQGVLTVQNFKVQNATDNLGVALLGEGYNKLGVYDYDNGIYPGFKYLKASRQLIFTCTESASSPTGFLSNGSSLSHGRLSTNDNGRAFFSGFYGERYNIGDYRWFGFRSTMPSGEGDGEHAAGEYFHNLGTGMQVVGWKSKAYTSTNPTGSWVAQLVETSPITDSYTGSYTPDASASTKHRVTLTGNMTINAPINGVDGQYMEIELTQDGTGSRTVTWNSIYQWSTDLPEPTLSTTPGYSDKFKFEKHDGAGKWRCVGYILGYH